MTGNPCQLRSILKKNNLTNDYQAVSSSMRHHDINNNQEPSYDSDSGYADNIPHKPERKDNTLKDPVRRRDEIHTSSDTESEEDNAADEHGIVNINKEPKNDLNSDDDDDGPLLQIIAKLMSDCLDNLVRIRENSERHSQEYWGLLHERDNYKDRLHYWDIFFKTQQESWTQEMQTSEDKVKALEADLTIIRKENENLKTKVNILTQTVFDCVKHHGEMEKEHSQLLSNMMTIIESAPERTWCCPLCEEIITTETSEIHLKNCI